MARNYSQDGKPEKWKRRIFQCQDCVPVPSKSRTRSKGVVNIDLKEKLEMVLFGFVFRRRLSSLGCNSDPHVNICPYPQPLQHYLPHVVSTPTPSSYHLLSSYLLTYPQTILSFSKTMPSWIKLLPLAISIFVKKNLDPFNISDSTHILPCMRLTSRFEIDSSSPVPPYS